LHRPDLAHSEVTLAPGATAVATGVSALSAVSVGNVYVGGASALAVSAGVEWPVVVGRPPVRADAFQERPALRDAVTSGLAAAGTTVGVTQVVTGDGGTGKTQLAGAVFTGAVPGVDVAVWVTATTREAVISAYASAYDLLHPTLGPSAGGSADQRAQAFLNWLTGTGRRWLVVLDDVADPADVDHLWPAGPAGWVVVTTRRRDAALTSRGPLISVDVYTDTEAVAYLTTRLSGIPGMPADVLDQAAELAEDLGRLPLALSHAAAMILDEGITCAGYRRQWADRSRRLSDLFPADPAAAGGGYARTVAVTWSLARDHADALGPAGLAVTMLNLISVLDPNSIPETVLTSQPACQYLTIHHDRTIDRPREVSPDQARWALRNLHRLSLISHDPDQATRSVRIHALAQRAAIEAMTTDALITAVRAGANALTAAWPNVEADTARAQALRANAAVLMDRNPQALWQPGAHPLLYRHGRSLGEAGLVTEARTYFQQLIAHATQALGPDHPDTLTTRHEAAYWRGEAGDLAGAATAFEELLADHLRVLGPDHPHTLTTRHELWRWRGEAGDPAGAALATEQMLADMLRVLGPDHPHTLASRHEIAYWWGKAGDPTRAATAFDEVLADQLRVLGPDHPHTLTTRHNLAYWGVEVGDPARAITAFAELLADQLRLLGPDHPRTMSIRHNLARWRGEAGDPAGAALATEPLLADMLRVLGPDHPRTMIARHNLARWRSEAADAAGGPGRVQEFMIEALPGGGGSE
jgi:hypothetical protein